MPTEITDHKLKPLGQPLFLADWTDVTFLHFRVPPGNLQPCVPLPLDLRDGCAWVSLVAFTMRRMRPVWAERAGEWLLRPLSPCRFLNVRTYVRGAGEPGIFFLKEWISNRLCVPLGPLTFGLPYRLGRLDYPPPQADGTVSGSIVDPSPEYSLTFRGKPSSAISFSPCAAGSLDGFLLERYTAFTRWFGWNRCFRIRHAPWLQRPLSATLAETTLLARAGPWSREAEYTCAHYSPGVSNVQISWPSPTQD